MPMPRISPQCNPQKNQVMRRAEKFGVLLGVSLAIAPGGILPVPAGPAILRAQNLEVALTARARVFPDVGPGLAALERDAAGRYYFLAGAGKFIAIYSAEGKRVGQVPAAGAGGRGAIVYAADLDLDSAGRIYVADRGANAVKIFAADGSLETSIAVPAPTSVAALGGGEIAVTTLRPERLVSIYNEQGKLVRSFGDLAEMATGAEASKRMNPGRLCGDGRGDIFYVFLFLPEPTVRKFDRFGYAAYEISLDAKEFTPDLGETHLNVLTLDRRATAAPAKPVVNAFGADAGSGGTWIAIGNELLHFDKDGARRSTHHLFLPEGAPLEPKVILVEPERLLAGADPIGIFEFEKPDKDPAAASAK
jgi:hypothetical protein